MSPGRMDEGEPLRAGRWVRAACKPGSVLDRGRGVAIHLGRTSPHASRNLPERQPGKGSRPRTPPLLFGLAPGGVCRATTVAGGAVRSYRTLSPLTRRRPPEGVHPGGRIALCGTFPGVAPAGRYPAPFSVEPGLSSRGCTGCPAIPRAATRPPRTRRSCRLFRSAVQARHGVDQGRGLRIEDAVDAILPPMALEGSDDLRGDSVREVAPIADGGQPGQGIRR
jgi:hypothetical protein